MKIPERNQFKLWRMFSAPFWVVENLMYDKYLIISDLPFWGRKKFIKKLLVGKYPSLQNTSIEIN